MGGAGISFGFRMISKGPADAGEEIRRKYCRGGALSCQQSNIKNGMDFSLQPGTALSSAAPVTVAHGREP